MALNSWSIKKYLKARYLTSALDTLDVQGRGYSIIFFNFGVGLVVGKFESTALISGVNKVEADFVNIDFKTDLTFYITLPLANFYHV